MLDGMLDSLSRCLVAQSARRVSEFRIAESAREQADALAERANEGLLSDDDRTGYEALVNASDFIAILTRKAVCSLASNQDV